MSLEKLKELLESEEGIKSAMEHFGDIQRRKQIEKTQLERFHEKFKDNFDFIVEKVLEKYESDEYRNKWFNLGFEPPEPLINFLYEYSNEYGRTCNEEEWEKYGNEFTADLNYIHGWYFNLMIGQGSVIKVTKE